ncbi:ABC transporter substrate-binding protein [Streptomyces roseirectus]|uniref:ABC transporter substrate-binding protein n=1 Tax=Streptomyces roseirectus TaxID=2768066 RepID=A0A7H0IPF1_9ACTN|nr:ABC transporter substrate-binding protein [Streptomyces roseirectus]QNP74667.1 ABC transporter substrate-binding protein [Streptomyces roseirectus]
MEPEFWPASVLIAGPVFLLLAAGTGVWLLLTRSGYVHAVRNTLMGLCVLLGAGAITALVWAADLPDYCQSGNERLVREGGECIGVSDGGHVYISELAKVSRSIKTLNDEVTGGDKPYATVALMIPMTPAAGDKADRDQILREVQGAYLAQYRANKVDDSDIGLRLVLANPGRGLDHGRQVADWLGELTRTDDRLRVVFGFNLSTRQNADTIGYLTKDKGIPVVGGPITATDLANDASGRYPGLVKVVPSNRDQAQALSHYLGGDRSRTFLIQDENSDDLYSRSLRDAFQEVTRGAAGGPETYDAAKVLYRDFRQMVGNVCDSRATTVYFAGRPPALADLIRALGDRGCAERPIRVVTVSGASTITLDPDLDWGAFTRGAGLTVEYATITHPDAWKAGARGRPATGGSPDDLAKLTDVIARQPGIGAVDLADGRTITMFDAATTAYKGIEDRMDDRETVPALADIKESWRRMRGQSKVKGASGWICLRSDGTPYDKAVAVVRLVPPAAGKGGKDGKGTLAFQAIAWPTGRPLTEDMCRNARG